MLTGVKKAKASIDGIIGRLAVKQDQFNTFYETPTREEYFTLVDAALDGQLDGVVSVGRSGVYFKECLISPPAEA